MAKRVHQMAKELDVKSVSIVEKCQAEGLDIKNHMSTISVGLAETIRGWFSEDIESSAIESSAKVDLAKVKVKIKKKRAAKKIVAVAVDTAIAVETSEEKSEIKEGGTKDVVAVDTAEVAKPKKLGGLAKPRRKNPADVNVDSDVAQPSEGVSDVEVSQTSKPESKKEVAPAQGNEEVVEAVKPLEPPKPFVPTAAKLQGPKVIRVEHAEDVPVRKKLNGKNAVSSDDESGASKPARGGGNKPSRSGGASTTEQGPSPADSDGGKGGKGGSRKKTMEDDRGNKNLSHRQKAKIRERFGGRKGNLGSRDWAERQARLEGASGSKLHRREKQMHQQDQEFGSDTKIEKATVKEPVTIKDLSTAMSIRENEIMGKLMGLGVMASINQPLELEVAETVALEFGVELTVIPKILMLDQFKEAYDAQEDEAVLQTRPPVVAFLGHVDHGKTSLMDRIRGAKVVSDEAGGITQHIGSYLYDDGARKVALLDTPGHKAFTAMRARGANMTDVAVLVVAADDGVMPQTEEAIAHLKAADVSIVVALNKVDIPGVDENRVLGQLAEKNLIPTSWGGDVEVVRTSAETGEGLDDLIEYLDYVSEVRNLKANPNGKCTGWVVEAEITHGQGVVASVLIKNGTINIGDVVVSGDCFGRVRSMVDGAGNTVTSALPSTPVAISGLEGVPQAGDRFFVVDDITIAKEAAGEHRAKLREKTLARRQQVTLENLFTEIQAGEVSEVNVILKGDVQGSVEVLSGTVLEMNTDEVAVRVLHSAVGGITESDVVLAEASNAIIIGFQVVADEYARKMAENRGVEIRLYKVIYQINDDLKQALEGMLKPRIEEKIVGRVEVREVFKVTRLGTIAGCYVTEGRIARKSKVRLIRENIIVRDNAELESLKRIKDDTNEVKSGLECGVKLKGFDDIKIGDIFEVYEEVEVTRTLGA